jgi:hypothetical protein
MAASEAIAYELPDTGGQQPDPLQNYGGTNAVSKNRVVAVCSRRRRQHTGFSTVTRATEEKH